MVRRLAQFGFILLAPISLNSCANVALEQVEGAKSEIVGMAKSELFACAGLPDLENTDEHGRYYAAYEVENTAHVLPPYPGSVFYPSVRVGSHRGWGVGGYYPVTVPKQQKCKATFKFEKGKVTSLSYQTNDQSEGSRALCLELIRSCLKDPQTKLQ